MTTLRTTLRQARALALPSLAQDLLPGELEALLAELGQPRYRARQVFHWLHARFATAWAQCRMISLRIVSSQQRSAILSAVRDDVISSRHQCGERRA